jgi:hypothetical protein
MICYARVTLAGPLNKQGENFIRGATLALVRASAGTGEYDEAKRCASANMTPLSRRLNYVFAGRACAEFHSLQQLLIPFMIWSAT